MQPRHFGRGKRGRCGDWTYLLLAVLTALVTVDCHRPTVGSGVVQVRYRYRIYPSPGQQQALARVFGCARVVYNGEIGVDLGLNSLIVTSDGEAIPNPRFLRKASKRLRRAQRVLSRGQEGSA